MCCPAFNHYRSANLEGERWEELFILCFHCFNHSLHSVSISKPLKVKPNANKIKFVWHNAFQLNLHSSLPPPPNSTQTHTLGCKVGYQNINFESWQLARWCSKKFDVQIYNIYYTCIHCGVSVCQLVCLTWDWLPSAVSWSVHDHVSQVLKCVGQMVEAFLLTDEPQTSSLVRQFK